MKNRDEKLLVEAYIKIYEGKYPGDDNQLAAEYTKAIQGDYTNFIKWLKTYADDQRLQKLILSGNRDGSPSDDAFRAEQTAIPVQKLKPTQKEIGIPDSLQYPCTMPDKFKNCFNNPVTIVGPIITLNGEYVLDGHHRWSQVYAINPETSITAINLTNASVTPEEALKAIQAAVAALRGEVPEKPAAPGNLLTIAPEQLKQDVLKLLTDEVINTAKQMNYATDKESFANKIVQNVNKMRQTSQPAPGAPARIAMPQPGEAKPPLSVDDKNITTGNINFKPPIVAAQ